MLPIVYVTAIVCGLPASSPLPQVGLFMQACTVIVLLKVPAPRRLAGAGPTSPMPLLPLMEKSVIVLTAGPVELATMYRVPLTEPVTVPTTVWLCGGVAAGLAAEKVIVFVLSENVALLPPVLVALLEELLVPDEDVVVLPPEPEPPPPQPVTWAIKAMLSAHKSTG